MRWAVFDIGGVLANIRTTWVECAGAAGVPVDAARLPHGDLTSCPNFEPYQLGALTSEEYLGRLAEFLSVTPDEARRVHMAILCGPTEGTLEIIERLDAAGIGTACLSNTNELHWIEMTQSGNYPNIEALQLCIASHNVKLAKPDPAIYALLEKSSGALANVIMYFEDHSEYVNAARARGWDAALVDPSDDVAGQIHTKLLKAGSLRNAL